MSLEKTKVEKLGESLLWEIEFNVYTITDERNLWLNSILEMVRNEGIVAKGIHFHGKNYPPEARHTISLASIGNIFETPFPDIE